MALYLVSEKKGGHCVLETVQDFLIKLGIKPVMHLLEVHIFSLNYDIIRLAKIMDNLVKDLKILIFQCLKLVECFQEKYLIRRQTFIKRFLNILMFEVLNLLKICPIFVGSVHDFGRSDGVIIY